MHRCGLVVFPLSVLVGCRGPGSRGEDPGFAAAATGGADTHGDAQAATGTTDEGTPADTGPTKFDVPSGGETAGETGVPPQSCKVVDEMNAPGVCARRAPADSFNPTVQWSWEGEEPYSHSIVIPLVANLTDDNGDGEVDLCDVPDVVVIASTDYPSYVGRIFVLDGLTGTKHWASEELVVGTVTPALGDLDGDGVAEIITIAAPSLRLVGYRHDGSVIGMGDVVNERAMGALALANMDNAGGPEIIYGRSVYTTSGSLILTVADSLAPDGFGHATVAADLDGDGDLELVLGRSAYQLDGGEVYRKTDMNAGYPQVANLDDDPEPEILLGTEDGITILEHEGSVKRRDLRPTGDPASQHYWLRASAVHDLDGDNVSDFAAASGAHYTAFRRDGAPMWSAPVQDDTGVGSGTAFDFLGDGIAEAMYADETHLFVFDGMGSAVVQELRSSRTLIEYPVVADIDNDGSAEILVVSNAGFDYIKTAPLIQAIRDTDDRWVPARRIWNQHAYHVTNVREDGTIPQFEPPSWSLLNTYRTNAQIEAGGICKPEG